MYEDRNRPLLSRRKFAGRVARHLLLALFLVSIALEIGVLGYHFLGGLSWIDSLLNASMILAVDPLHSIRSQDFRFLLRLIFGTSVHRHRIADRRPRLRTGSCTVFTLVKSEKHSCKDFAGARGFSVVSCPMIKRVLLAALGSLALCFPIVAQQTGPLEQTETVTLEQLSFYRPEFFSTVDSSILIHDLPMLTFLDGRLPVSSALGRMGNTSLGVFPIAFVSAAETHKANASPASGTDSQHEVTTLQLNPEYWGGEVGVFYGRSSGKFGREDFGSYIVGGVGNEKFQITVGASYEESNGRVPRWAR